MLALCGGADPCQEFNVTRTINEFDDRLTGSPKGQEKSVLASLVLLTLDRIRYGRLMLNNCSSS